MFIKVTFCCVGIVVACLGAMTQDAKAITAEVAHACNALVEKSFPPRQPGNPAAGSKSGSAKAQRDYFAKCVANGGKMDGNPSDGTKSK